jgi:hypothetical protein
MKFDNFWNANLEKYKSIAKTDFELQSKAGWGAWIANMKMETGNNFALDIPKEFTIFGASHEEVKSFLIERLQIAQFNYIKKYPVAREGFPNKSFDCTPSWKKICADAISSIKENNSYIYFEGIPKLDIIIHKNS